ncbi:hypothetical protein [Beijerinckia indica]|uniref:hypothetical protein n=1 Tax=Beijerinckia indica TaxID=533 RepID=UPI0005A2C801|nr:hypothetical protein [Beijerinckia indica]
MAISVSAIITSRNIFDSLWRMSSLPIQMAPVTESAGAFRAFMNLGFAKRHRQKERAEYALIGVMMSNHDFFDTHIKVHKIAPMEEFLRAHGGGWSTDCMLCANTKARLARGLASGDGTA